MSLTNFNLGELTAYCHRDDVHKIIDIFGEQVTDVMQSYNIHSKVDIEMLHKLHSLKRLYISPRTIDTDTVCDILKNDELENLEYFSYYVKLYGEYEDVFFDVSRYKSIDFSKMRKLKKLCVSGKYTGIDKLKNLTTLKVSGNDIRLNLSDLSSLKKLIVSCYDKNMETIIFPTNNNIEYIEISDLQNSCVIDLSNCKKMGHLKLRVGNVNKFVLGQSFILRYLKIYIVKIDDDFLSDINDKFPNLEILKLQCFDDANLNFRNFTNLKKLCISTIFDVKINLEHNVELTSLTVECNGRSYKKLDNIRRNSVITGVGKLTKLNELKVIGIDNYLNLKNLINLKKLKYSYCPNIHGVGNLMNLVSISGDNIPITYLDKFDKLQHLSYCMSFSRGTSFIRFDKIKNKNIVNNITTLKLRRTYRIVGIERFENLQKITIHDVKSIIGLDTITHLKKIHDKISSLKYNHSMRNKNYDVINSHDEIVAKRNTIDLSKMAGLKYLSITSSDVYDIYGMYKCQKLRHLICKTYFPIYVDISTNELLTCCINTSNEDDAFEIYGIRNNTKLTSLETNGKNGIDFDEISKIFNRLIILYAPQTMNPKYWNILRDAGIHCSY